jgi:benzoyl-CoA-dihydrodiol lyase
MDATLLRTPGHWLVRETVGLLRRTLSRLDVSSRSLFALIEPGSCFAGTFLELALACDRSYHLALPDDAGARTDDHRRRGQLRPLPDGHRPEPPGPPLLRRARAARSGARPPGQPLDADAAHALGLVTSNPDDIDWADEPASPSRSAWP